MWRSKEYQNKTDFIVATLESISASQGMIEFDLDGTIITANENYLAALGYQLSEIEGKHHGIFVEPEHKESAEYRQFWDDLRDGVFQAGEFSRLSKSGGEVWIQATYNPVLDLDGKPYKVVKIAVDITTKKRAALETKAKVERQAADILELSTPAIAVWDSVFLLPLIGTLDSARMQRCTEGALSRLSENDAQILIIDITGVPVMDTMVANHLIAMATCVGLMGGRCILTGISPATAVTIVSLGLDLSSLNTRGTLQEGLKLAIELIEDEFEILVMIEIPVLKIGDLLLVSIQNELNDRVATALQEEILQRIEHSRATALLIDILYR